MLELKDFVYELHRYADQTHILKDKYEKLSEAEKAMVVKHAPINQPTPEEHYELVYRWLEKVQSEVGVVEKEER
ncbi:hypothetical protein [Virgibacillus necropolis]|uniref:Uncharacterized protein n=1 Tax=Virgibacillus necropolis TaxID=163877 RepID=A0A221ME65_9BACI|nr:hypothetical protein [Virgibacillus necropolis]ASN05924.1 hypothetical protein CFK40_13320 [Virgibacillus necropolis]